MNRLSSSPLLLAMMFAPIVLTALARIASADPPGFPVKKIYTFDRGDEGFVLGSSPIGHDGWVGSNGIVGPQVVDNPGNIGTGLGLATTARANHSGAAITGSAFFYRPNDAAFSYSIPAEDHHFAIEFDVQGAWLGTFNGMRNLFGLTQGDPFNGGDVVLWFGISGDHHSNLPTRYWVGNRVGGPGDGLTFWNDASAMGAHSIRTEFGEADNKIHHLKLEVDLSGGPNGVGMLYEDGVLLAMANGSTAFNIGLETAPSTWDGLLVNISSFGKNDNLTITTFFDIPEPSTLLLAAFGLLGLVGRGLRRRVPPTAYFSDNV